MKTIIISVVVFLFVAIGFGGYAYWMQGRLTDMSNQKTAVEAQLTTAQAELQVNVAELTTANQTIADQKAITDGELFNVETLTKLLSGLELSDIQTKVASSTGSTTASGTLTASGAALPEITESGALSRLDQLYSPLVHVESVGAPVTSLAKYKLQLQKTFSPTTRILGYPVEMSQGEWTFIVALTQTPAKNQVQLTSTGTTAPVAKELANAPTQELVPMLVKWSEGKIIEQYTFDYPGITKSSKLLQNVKN